jgi:hypothetical protein
VSASQQRRDGPDSFIGGEDARPGANENAEIAGMIRQCGLAIAPRRPTLPP